MTAFQLLTFYEYKNRCSYGHINQVCVEIEFQRCVAHLTPMEDPLRVTDQANLKRVQNKPSLEIELLAKPKGDWRLHLYTGPEKIVEFRKLISLKRKLDSSRVLRRFTNQSPFTKLTYKAYNDSG